MKKSIYLLLLSILMVHISESQVCPSNYGNPWEWGSHSNWFFGNGIFLNFPGGTGTPVATYKPIDAGCTLGFCNTNQSYEGTAAISDNAGTLLAYSNGRTFWKADGSVVTKGLLAGNESGSVGERSSAVQGIVTVRHPLNTDELYVFTSDDALTSTDVGLNYTVYNIKTNTMSAPIRLKTDLGIDYRATEQVEATFHSNGYDVWVVVRQSGKNNKNDFRNFYSYLITCDGLNTVPVKSNQVGPEMGHRWDFGAAALSLATWANDWERGAIKISWDGTKAAVVNDISSGDDQDEAVTIYDFNNSTGLFSNVKVCGAVEGQWFWTGAPSYYRIYDCEWAPDSKGLYFVETEGTRLLYLDGSLSSGTNIYSSIKTISNSAARSGDLKLGGDGKLYQATFANNLNSWSFPSVANLNSGTSSTYSSIPLAQNSQRGLSNMFHPPTDVLSIQNPGQLCAPGSIVNLSTIWACSGISAETLPHTYTSTRGAIVDANTGTYDPKIAGIGKTDTVIFTLTGSCGRADTLILNIVSCLCTKDTSLVVGNLTICPGDLLDLNSIKITSEPGNWSITSSPSGTNPASIIGSNFISLNNDLGNYTVKHTLTDKGDPSCPDGASRNITVRTLPTNIGSNLTVCSNASPVTLTSSNVDANAVWSSSPSGLITSGGVVNIVSAFASVGDGGKVTVTYGGGCTTPTSVDITINICCITPTNVVINTSKNPSCKGDNITLTANSNKGTGQTYIYTWYKNSISLANLDTIITGDSTYSFTADKNDVYLVVVSDQADPISCSAPSLSPLNLVVNPLPVVTVNNAEICEGDLATTFTATTDLPAIAASWLWSVKGSGTNISTSGTEAGNYTVQVTDANGCIASATGILTVNQLPNVTVNSATVCAGDPATKFEAVSTSTITAYDWTLSGNGTGTAQSTMGSTAGPYIVQVTDNKGCKKSTSGTLTINALPVISISDANLCSGTTSTIDATTASATAYSWNDGSTNPVLSISAPGTYTVNVTVNGCKGSDDVLITQVTSPTVSLPSDTTICEKRGGESYKVVLTHNGSLGGTISWNTGATGTDNILVTTTDSEIIGTYTDLNNCSDSDTINITEYCKIPDIFVPTVVIPESPTNTSWTPFGGVTASDIIAGTSHFEVYDRWGLKMFETDAILPVWDCYKYNGGTKTNLVTSGVYFWIWKFTDVSDKEHNINGYVEILRK